MEPYYRVLEADTPQEAEIVMNRMKEAGYRVAEVSFWRRSGSDKIIMTFEREK